MPITIHVTSMPGRGARRVAVQVSGEIDVATAPILAEHLRGEIDCGRDRIVVLLGRVGFCGLAGLDVLVEARARATRRGGHLSLADLSPRVRRLLTLADVIGAGFPLVAPSRGAA